jgi:hypothetical protein
LKKSVVNIKQLLRWRGFQPAQNLKRQYSGNEQSASGCEALFV